jgi:nucleoside-diphosphate-sugar epimerase
VEAGNQVQVLDDFSSGHERNLEGIDPDLLDVSVGSVVDLGIIRKLAAGCEVIYHLAAQPSVPKTIEEPIESHQINSTGTLNALEAARMEKVPRVVFASSCAVYGDAESGPKHEGMAPDPRSPYALQKLTGEFYCRQYAALFGLGAIALRFFNVFGPRQDPNSAYAAVVPRFAAAISEGKAAMIFGDGKQTRDFVYVGDVVNALRAAAETEPEARGSVLNIASGQSRSILDVHRTIAHALGCETIEPEFAPPRPGDVRHSHADASEAARVLGWSSKVSFEDGVARILAESPGRRDA